jgi:hypothetical protein
MLRPAEIPPRSPILAADDDFDDWELTSVLPLNPELRHTASSDGLDQHTAALIACECGLHTGKFCSGRG